jgi:hypothetical protein
MGTVTIAATYGCREHIIGPAVANRLGLPLQSSALDEDSDDASAAGRLLNSILDHSGLFVGVPISPEEQGVLLDIAHAELAIRGLADGGGAVVVGRAGVFVLQDRSDVLHVRLDGNAEARRRAAMVQEGLDYASASRMQHQIDRARRAYIRRFHPRAGVWEDPSNYHLVLDSTVISVETCTEIIVRAAQDRFRSA